MSPYTSLDHLIDKSLVTLVKNEINMHALVQELGLYIGKKKGSHLKMVKKFRVQNGDKVRALKLAELDIERFKEMPNLHFLVLNECVLYGNNKDIFEEVRYMQLRINCTINCTIKPLLCKVEASKSDSHSEHTEYISGGGFRYPYLMPTLSNLVSMDMSGSSKFTSFEGSELAVEGCPNLLTLNLSKWESITTLPNSIEHLSTLQVFNLTDCRKLQKLPESIDHLTSLQELLLGGCESLVALPKFITRLRDCSDVWRAYYRYAAWEAPYDSSDAWYRNKF